MSSDNKLFAHYSDFPMSEWRWPDFSPLELSCKGTGQLMVDFASMDALQSLRNDLGVPIYLNSAFRSALHNKNVGGAKGSQHLKAKAFDCRMANHDPATFEARAKAAGFRAFGYYVKQNFMHIDTRDRPSRWGKPFPASKPHRALSRAPARTDPMPANFAPFEGESDFAIPRPDSEPGIYGRRVHHRNKRFNV